MRIDVIEGYPNERVVVAIRIQSQLARPAYGRLPGEERDPHFTPAAVMANIIWTMRKLRDSFTQTADLTQRVRRFRDERIALLLAGEGPVLTEDTPKVILHLIPYIALDNAAGIDVTQDIAASKSDFTPIGVGSFSSSRYNADGYLGVSGEQWLYPKSFRNGAIEAVDTELGAEHYTANGVRFLPAGMLGRSDHRRMQNATSKR